MVNDTKYLQSIFFMSVQGEQRSLAKAYVWPSELLFTTCNETPLIHAYKA